MQTREEMIRHSVFYEPSCIYDVFSYFTFLVAFSMFRQTAQDCNICSSFQNRNRNSCHSMLQLEGLIENKRSLFITLKLLIFRPMFAKIFSSCLGEYCLPFFLLSLCKYAEFHRRISIFLGVSLDRALLSRRMPRSPHYEYSRQNYGIRGILVDWQSSFRGKRRAYHWPGYVNNGHRRLSHHLLVVPSWLMKQLAWRRPIMRLGQHVLHTRLRYRFAHGRTEWFFPFDRTIKCCTSRFDEYLNDLK